MKIDAFSHVRPQAYADAVERMLEAEMGLGSAGNDAQTTTRYAWQRPLVDASARIRFMDEAGVDKQVITLTVPPIEQATKDASVGAQLAMIANNAVRDMADEYPDRLLPVGTVAMDDVDAACSEAERCLTTLGMKGVQIYTNANGKYLNDPSLQPFFELMNRQERPIWLHPYYNPRQPDLKPAMQGLNIAQVFGWPFDTVVAMTCLVFGGVLDRYPNLKFVTHYAGASVPFFDQRIATHVTAAPQLRRPVLDYYRSFYVDSAVQGSVGAMQASYAFYGASHIVFGTDMPFASVNGDGNTKQSIASIEALDVPAAEKEAMFSGNLLRLIGE